MDVGKAVGASELDGGVVSDIEVVEVGKNGSDNADVETVIGKYQFTQADEG